MAPGIQRGFVVAIGMLAATMLLLYIVPAARADDSDADQADSFAPVAQTLGNDASLNLSATWNGTPLTGTTTVPLHQPGTISWNYVSASSSSRFGVPSSLDDILSTAVLTLDIYKGTVGSSTLVFSETVSSTPQTIPFTFDSAGPYLLAFTATYPDGSYPPGKGPTDLCHLGDFCLLPHFFLSSFQQVMANGSDLVANGTPISNYVPAAYGLLAFNVSAVPSGPTISNVLFLPGTLESRLYMKTSTGEHRLWEPSLDSDIAALAFNADGTSKNTIYTRDIMDHLYSADPPVAALVKAAAGNDSVMYGPFEDFMNAHVANGTIKEWRAYPYDWRYDVSDIVHDGTLVGTATSTPTRLYLEDVVQQLASSSPTGKVSIIAHSNGGLVAKALMVQLQKEGRLNLIDQLILVGTPQLGTPLSIGTMLHGDDETRALGIVTYSGTFRDTGLTTPGAYDLLPSAAYFEQNQVPVVSFASDTASLPYRMQYGTQINSYSQLSDFLTNVGNTRNVPSTFDLLTPAVLSSDYVQKAATTHEAIDAWTPPPDISVTSLVGWGRPTVASYSYATRPSSWSCSFSGFLQLHCGDELEHTHTKINEGDNTVIAASAAASGRALYLDTQQLLQHGETITHQSLLTSSTSQAQLLDIMEKRPMFEPFVDTSTPSDAVTPMVAVGVHSPMNILATDDSGRQTGIVPVEGFLDFYFLKEDIPGSAVDTVDDEKYVSLPADGSYTFALQGYAVGTTTIDISSIDAQGNATETQIFADIPTTAQTSGTFSIAHGVATPPTVSNEMTNVSNVVLDSGGSSPRIPSVGLLRPVSTSTYIGKKIDNNAIRNILLELLNRLRAAKTWFEVLQALEWAQKALRLSVKP